MSQENLQLQAEIRSVGGTSQARKLRQAGKVPAIIYGDGGESIAVSLPNKELNKLLEIAGSLTRVIDLGLEGKVQQVMIKHLDMAAIGHKILHLDLFRVSKTKQVTVKVGLRFIGESESEAVKIDGGSLLVSQNEAEIVCLPADIPGCLEVNIGQLKLGQTIYLSDISLPAGVALADTEHNPALATMNKPRGGALLEEVEGEAAEEEGKDGGEEAS